jgi:hypothetical protein
VKTKPFLTADGAALEFVAYDTSDVNVQRDNPFLSQTEMFRVITRSLDLYRRRHAGRSPTRVMIHKSTEFKPEEMDGCFEALKHIEAEDLVQVVEDNGWQAARWEQDRNDPNKSQAHGYPVKRGHSLASAAKTHFYGCMALWTDWAIDLTSRVEKARRARYDLSGMLDMVLGMIRPRQHSHCPK